MCSDPTRKFAAAVDFRLILPPVHLDIPKALAVRRSANVCDPQYALRG